MARAFFTNKRQLVLLAESVLLILLAFAIAMTTIALLDSMDVGGIGEEDVSEALQRDGQNAPAEYILPESDSRVYSREELDDLSDWDLYLAHNEIYARKGRMFDREDLASYFASCAWYEPIYTPEEFDALPSPLNEIEQKNSETMVEMRRERNDPNL